MPCIRICTDNGKLKEQQREVAFQDIFMDPCFFSELCVNICIYTDRVVSVWRFTMELFPHMLTNIYGFHSDPLRGIKQGSYFSGKETEV